MYGAKFSVSIFLGVICGIFTYINGAFLFPSAAPALALIGGSLCAMLVFPVLVFSERRVLRKYAEVEKNIKSPVLYKTNGNFILDRQVKNGNIYFCETGVLMISLRKKTWLIDEVLMQNIAEVRFDNLFLILRTKDGRIFRILVPDAKEAEEALNEKGWFV